MIDSTSRVQLDIEGDIAVVHLNRPEKYNGLDQAMFVALIKCARRLRRNKKVRCVILCGHGPVFSSGLDVMSIKKNPLFIPRLLIKPGNKISNMAQDVALAWRQLPVPVIAVMHGKCYGGALQIALAADFRFATPGCECSIMEIKWGLIPDMSGSVTLPELTRSDIVRELVYTGRLFSAKEAQQWGLVTRVCDDPMAEAYALAGEIATRSPDAVTAAKKLLTQTWKADLKTALFWETRLQRKLLGRWNQLAAVSKNLSRKPWAYRKRAIS